MTEIDLKEYAPAEFALSAAQLDALLHESKALDLSIEPIPDSDGSYRIRAGPRVGAVEIADLSVLIEPKIGIPQLLSLACYAMGVFRPQEEGLFDFEESEALPDTLAIALASAARRAFVEGLLHGYREEEEALQTIRGRIRLEEQMRRRFGVGLPVEVRYDEFTDDILANRLVRAAVSRLSGMRLRSLKARRGLSWVAAMLEQVSPVEFGPNDVPEIRFDRLNDAPPVRTLPRGTLPRGGARPACASAQRVRVRPRRRACVRIPDGHEQLVSGVRYGGPARGTRGLRADITV